MARGPKSKRSSAPKGDPVKRVSAQRKVEYRSLSMEEALRRLHASLEEPIRQDKPSSVKLSVSNERAEGRRSAPAVPEEMASYGPAAKEMANYKKLVERAVDVFGDEVKASKWLSLPNVELNGDTPLRVAQRNGYDGQQLEFIFTRIEHGIYF